MSDKAKAEEAARAMGWRQRPYNDTITWFVTEGRKAPCSPDLTNDIFVMAMARWIEYEAGPGYLQAQVRNASVDHWPDIFADTVIAEARR